MKYSHCVHYEFYFANFHQGKRRVFVICFVIIKSSDLTMYIETIELSLLPEAIMICGLLTNH